MSLSRIGALYSLICAAVFTSAAHADSPSSRLPESLAPVLEESCVDCHDQKSHKGGLDLTSLSKDLLDPSVRERWIRISAPGAHATAV